jgi:hypothetical protein
VPSDEALGPLECGLATQLSFYCAPAQLPTNDTAEIRLTRGHPTTNGGCCVAEVGILGQSLPNGDVNLIAQSMGAIDKCK